jgi:hypothetical protein
MAWMSVLKLSAFWQMDRLHDIAIDELSASSKKTRNIQWMALLDMSTRHEISAGRDLAINELISHDPASAETLLMVAREYQSKALFLKGCRDFVNAPADHRFSDEKLAKLDMTTVVKLFYCRERVAADGNDVSDEVISDEFEGLLKEMRDD